MMCLVSCVHLRLSFIVCSVENCLQCDGDVEICKNCREGYEVSDNICSELLDLALGR